MATKKINKSNLKKLLYFSFLILLFSQMAKTTLIFHCQRGTYFKLCSFTLQGWPTHTFHNVIFLSRAPVSAKIKTCRRCSIKLSAVETLYPQLLWQLWKTAISALCIIVHALRWGVSEETTEPSSSVHDGTFVIANHQHFCMQKGHFPISCHEITLPAFWWRPALEALSTQFILSRDNSSKEEKGGRGESE